jgi:predicted aconitase with swiveling domain
VTRTSGGEPYDGRTLRGRTLSPGEGHGRLLVLDAPVSFWGGVGPTGTVVDRHHPQYGVSLTGRIVVMTSSKGSSSSSSVLAEHIRAGVAPAALVLREPDMIVTLGALAAGELYEQWVPVVVLAQRDHDGLRDEAEARVEATGSGALVTLGLPPVPPLSPAPGPAGADADAEPPPEPRPGPSGPDR